MIDLAERLLARQDAYGGDGARDAISVRNPAQCQVHFLDMPADAAARLRHYICPSRPEQAAAMFGFIHIIVNLGLIDAMLARCDARMTAYNNGCGRNYYAASKPNRRRPAARAGS